MDRDTPEAANEQPADNLRAIEGIGPQIAQRLYDAGVRTFADLARYSPDDLAAKARVSPQYVNQHNLVGQARELAKVPSPPGAGEPEISRENGEHPESFVLRLTLDSGNNIIRTVVQHAASKRKSPQWAGWDTDRLLEFLSEFVSLGGEAEETPVGTAAISAGGPEPEQQVAAAPEHAPPPGVPPLPAEILLRGVDPIAIASRAPQRSFNAHEPFAVRLAFDVQGTTPAREGALSYSVGVFARTVGESRRHIEAVGEHRGTVDEAGATTLEIRSTGLPSGTYRLEGTLRLYEPASSRPRQLAALDGGLLEVTHR